MKGNNRIVLLPININKERDISRLKGVRGNINMGYGDNKN